MQCIYLVGPSMAVPLSSFGLDASVLLASNVCLGWPLLWRDDRLPFLADGWQIPWWMDWWATLEQRRHGMLVGLVTWGWTHLGDLEYRGFAPSLELVYGHW